MNAFLDGFASLMDYFVTQWQQILSLTIEHIEMTAIAVGCSILIGVPLGILVSYVRKLGKPVIGIANVVQAIPSMALLGLAIPLLGIGTLPAVVMVIIYSLLPIVKNTYTGITNIDPLLVEAATGIGLTKWQVLYKIKLPMALPVIMAGVRISTVTAVGLMTMAAFIGAGGLGYLVFSGIRTVNNIQILAGAIPACILALVVDFLMGLIEKLVTPISLQKQFGTSKEKLKRRRTRSKAILGVAAALLVLMVGNTAYHNLANTSDRSIVIGSKDFTENIVLAHLYGQMIEAHTDIDVDVEDNLGGTQVCYEALQAGEIDMYLDYTGTVYVSLLNHPAKSDMEAVYQECRDELAANYDIVVLDKSPLNNTYTIAVQPETAEEYGLVTIADLQKCDDQLVIGTTLEFQNRPDDGLPGLVAKYGFQFKNTVGIDGSPRFIALEQGEIDIVDAFATDGLLKKYGLVTLEDTDGYFPPYNAIPMLRGEVLEEYPELADPINELSAALTDEEMQNMNYLVDEEGQEPAQVAADFLSSHGLL